MRIVKDYDALKIKIVEETTLNGKVFYKLLVYCPHIDLWNVAVLRFKTIRGAQDYIITCFNDRIENALKAA